MMSERHECNECQNILAELEAALAEIRLSPKLSKQLREDADLLLRLGTTEGSDDALERFPFQMPKQPRYPRIANVIEAILEADRREPCNQRHGTSDSSTDSEKEAGGNGFRVNGQMICGLEKAGTRHCQRGFVSCRPVGCYLSGK